jgi:hypothetical protein
MAAAEDHDGLPVIVVMRSPKNSTTLHPKLLPNIREVRARWCDQNLSPPKKPTIRCPFAEHLIEIPSASTLFQPYPVRFHCSYSSRRLKVTTSTSPALMAAYRPVSP